MGNKLKWTDRIATRIFAIAALFIVLSVVILGYASYESAKSELTEAGQNDLKVRVESAGELLDVLNDRVEAGELTLEEAQEEARVRLAGPIVETTEEGAPVRDFQDVPYTYGDQGYFYGFMDDGMTVIHPSGNEGKNLFDTQDDDGNYMIRGLIETSKEPNPEDRYYTYMWINAGEEEAREKNAYVSYYDEWGWMYGLAAYSDEFYEGAAHIGWMAFAIGLATVIIASATLYYFLHKMSKQINEVRFAAEKVASGQLTGENLSEKGKTEISHLSASINQMKERLGEMIGSIHEKSSQVAASSEELTASAQENNATSEHTAQEIQSLAEVAEQVKERADQSLVMVNEQDKGLKDVMTATHLLREKSEESVKVSKEGSSSMERTSGKMSGISNSVNESMNVISRLEERSKEISQIISTMTGISEQTNLLALNASIEAARAGENGRGFAIVADEVRKLAEQSGNSAEQIKGMIGDIQNDTSVSVHSMKKVTEDVEDGLTSMLHMKSLFSQVEDINSEVDGQILNVTNIVEFLDEKGSELKKVTEDFSTFAQTMTDSTSTVAATSEESLASMTEIARTAEELSSIAIELQDQINEFKT
ncbi:hypothetical protein CR203_17460 [Salipaludibacillus neizhouensis]|uniref:Chemotaxis protein n=1 Tax=Salipaludibacillus neizhouensis TaxID=885475 RepID=A0A3A9K130_9BACI|nr:methyl-accepting chemotaxis protein [Salipaludibacillus neizhouensis]RKL66079.1 hypothetical protein CR203_17460 [Salipaludibacillus neizhouensis]